MHYILSHQNSIIGTEIDTKQIAEFLVEYHGGGLNERQVSNAMLDNSRVISLPDDSSIDFPPNEITKLTWTISKLSESAMVARTESFLND